MISFRADEAEATLARRWAERLGIDRSELLREALHQHLVRLASEHDADSWLAQPLTNHEAELSAVSDWGPAEDWSDWADAAG
jgi:hypothetical protein